MSAGLALCPTSGEWLPLGIPFGPKPRLILTHLNREALLKGSPLIEAEESLTAFVRRLLGFEPNGREIRKFKAQLGSLAGATVRLAVLTAGGGFQLDTKVVSAFDLWFPKDSRQRVLWPQTVRLSEEYFESLQRHAVPLDERAVAALAHSAMGRSLRLAGRSACTGWRPGGPPSSPGRRSRSSSAGTMTLKSRGEQ